MKKIIAMILIALMMVAAVACGGGDSDTESPTTSPTTSAGQSPTSSPSQPTETVGGEQPTGPIGHEQYGGTVRVTTTSEGATPLGLPWNIYGIDVNLLPPFAESLLWGRVDGSYHPCLAEDFWVDTEALQVHFLIRQGVQFHDGSMLDAHVVVWNYENAMEADILNPAIISVEALDDYHVMFQLDRWQNTLWAGFASHSFAIVSKENYERNGENFAAENPVGTGPFTVANYIRGERILFERYPDYWQDGKPYLDFFEIVFIRDEMTQNIAFQSDGPQSIDILSTSSAEQVIMQQRPGVYVLMNSIGPVSLVPSSFDENSPLSDVRVRQAVSYAIDREAIVAARGFGLMTPSTQYFTLELASHARLPDSYNYSYNPDRARELLTEAGYPDGFNTTIHAMPGLVDRDAIIAVQAMLRDVGINAEVEFPDAGGYSDRRFGGWDGFLAQHTRAFSLASYNVSMYFDVRENPETGELEHNQMISAWRPYEVFFPLLQAATIAEIQPPEVLLELNRIMVEEMICVPMWNIFEFFVIKDHVHDTGYAFWAGIQPANVWIDN